MLVAVRNTSPANQNENRQNLEGFAQGKLDIIGEEARYSLVAAKNDVDRFTVLRVDYADVPKEISRTGYETRIEWRDMTSPPSNDIAEPLMPPRVGHMGLIMSGGGVGGLGIGLSNDEEATIFRAASKKVVDVEKVNESATVQRLTERMTSSAVTLDPSTWEFTDDVQLGGVRGEVEQGTCGLPCRDKAAQVQPECAARPARTRSRVPQATPQAHARQRAATGNRGRDVLAALRETGFLEAHCCPLAGRVWLLAT